MSANPLTAKIAAPYARALFDFSVEQNIMHQITADFQNLEVFLNEAQKRLSEAEKQLSQANIVISEIKNETISTKKMLLESDSFAAKKDLKIRFDRALATFRSKERQIFVEIKEQIISLVLNKTVVRAKEAFGPKERATALINDTINKLEGDLLWVQIH